MQTISKIVLDLANSIFFDNFVINLFIIYPNVQNAIFPFTIPSFSGSGAALDATTRNLSTVLIERSDFGNETYSRSTKLIWAGIRYIGTATGELLRMKNITQPIKAFKEFWAACPPGAAGRPGFKEFKEFRQTNLRI